jgi:hypothetical protein
MRLSVAFSIALTRMDDVACDVIMGTEWSSSQTSSGGSLPGDDDVVVLFVVAEKEKCCSGDADDIVRGDGGNFWPRRHLDEIAAIDCAAIHRNCWILDVKRVDLLLMINFSRPSA